MTRPLLILPVDGPHASEPLDVMALLRQALTASGPALMPVSDMVVEAGSPALFVPRRVAVVIETSGSTDVPKRVMLGTDALLASAAASADTLGGPGQWLLALPTHYIAGVQVLVRSIVAETIPVVMPPGHFDAQRFMALAETMSEPLRYTSLVPVQLSRLLAATDGDSRLLAVLRRFTAILIGGQAIRPELSAHAEQLGVRVVRTYGSSETCGGCVYNGLPIGNTQVRVRDGQLEMSGSVLAEGYLADPERTADRFIDDHLVRWYRTGDLGEVNSDTGEVRVLGRADNVIISGGEKVSLDAVERVVRSLSGFSEAVVVAADDAEWGQVPVVIVAGPHEVCEASEARSEAGMRDAVVSSLGRAARPARVVLVPAIPLLPSGKPDRRALAARL